MSVENTPNRHCCLLPSGSPVNPTLIGHIENFLTVLKTAETPLFYLGFVTDFAYISSWGFVCV